MSNLYKGILNELTKIGEFEYSDPVVEEESDDSKLKKAVLTGAAAAGLTQILPEILASPIVAQTALSGERSLGESKELLKRFAPGVRTVDISKKGLLSALDPHYTTGRSGLSTIAFTKNPYTTAHEIGHHLTRDELIKHLSDPKTEGSFLRKYVDRLRVEGLANVEGFRILKKHFGLGKALKSLPIFGSNLLSYATAMPLSRYPALSAIIPFGIGAGAYLAKDKEEDVI